MVCTIGEIPIIKIACSPWILTLESSILEKIFSVFMRSKFYFPSIEGCFLSFASRKEIRPQNIFMLADALLCCSICSKGKEMNAAVIVERELCFYRITRNILKCPEVKDFGLGFNGDRCKLCLVH